MLEQLLIFTRGGLVLWTWRELSNALRGTPIEALIRTCLLEERAGASAFQYDVPGVGGSYTLKWTFHNELGLVFVAVYQRFLHLLYVDELLGAIKREFAAIYNPKLTRYSGFDETFRQLQMEALARAEELRMGKQDTSVLQNSNKADGKRQNAGGHSKVVKASAKNQKRSDDPDGDSDVKSGGLTNNGSKGRSLVDGKTNKPASSDAVISNGIRKSSGSSSSSDDDVGKTADDQAFNLGKLKKMRATGKAGKKGSSTDTSKASKDEQGKKAKKNRVWNTAPAPTKLDFTDPPDMKEGYAKMVPVTDHGESLMDKDEYISESDDDKENEEEEVSGKSAPVRKGWFSSVFRRQVAHFCTRRNSFWVKQDTATVVLTASDDAHKCPQLLPRHTPPPPLDVFVMLGSCVVCSVAGKSSLELVDLEPALKALKERLMTKNVVGRSVMMCSVLC